VAGGELPGEKSRIAVFDSSGSFLGIKGVRVLWFVNHKSQFVFNKKPDRYKSARAFLFGGRGELVWRYNNLIYKLSWVQLLLVLQAMLLRFPT
jgi:hypothetical protein